jgi:hypothetical protein
LRRFLAGTKLIRRKAGDLMKRAVLMAAAIASLVAYAATSASPADDGLPQMLPGVRLMADGEVIDDHKLGHFVPTVVDWNGDGKKDLIVGAFAGEPGNVLLYLNVGTDAEPKLAKATYMEAVGQPIKLTGG